MDLYDLLISLSHTGREVASQQQGLTGTDSISCPNLLAEDIQVVRCFAECGTAHTAAWQGMPQAGISLSDTARCFAENDLYSEPCMAYAAPNILQFTGA